MQSLGSRQGQVTAGQVAGGPDHREKVRLGTETQGPWATVEGTPPGSCQVPKHSLASVCMIREASHTAPPRGTSFLTPKSDIWNWNLFYYVYCFPQEMVFRGTNLLPPQPHDKFMVLTPG